MKTNVRKHFRNSFVGLGALLIIGSLLPGLPTNEILSNEFLAMLGKKLQLYNRQSMEEKVYLQFDKSLYKPGETIWFSAYLRRGSDLHPSDKSEILYADLIDPKGNVIKSLSLIARNGVAHGDFSTGGDMPGGLYHVRAYTNWQKNFGDEVYFDKELQLQSVVLPRLFMRLDFTKKAYGPGDDVIAEMDVQTIANEPLAGHDFSFVVSLDGKKQNVKRSRTDEQGKAFIQYRLPEDLHSNDGVLNVMLDYEGSTESISRSIPITLGKIDLVFYPEGGDLVQGLRSRVAFKATDEFGKPADIEGVVYDKSGRQVTEFSSYHHGMGAFELHYGTGEAYVARITKPAGIHKEYALPEPLQRGWVMSLKPDGKNTLALTIMSTETEQMSLLAQVRGRICFTRSLQVKKGENSLRVPVEDFPMGVAQFTLFDSRNIERCERLVFVNKDRQLHIEIKTDKQKYLPREKVRLSIRVSDERGLPVPADLSLAVVDEKLLSFADDQSGNILSQLLLESDLSAKIEEPAFYFDPREKKADSALDYLLMTEGWRRFTWEEVLEQPLPVMEYEGELARISGTVFNHNGKALAHATISVDGHIAITDEEGYFEINDYDMYAQTWMKITARGYSSQNRYLQSYGQDIRITMYDPEFYRNMSMRRTKRKMAPNAAFMRAGGLPEAARKDENDLPAGFFIGNEAAMDDLPPKPQAGREQEIARGKWVLPLDAGMPEGEIPAEKAIGQFWDRKDMLALENKKVPDASLYYRAREFSSPHYDQAERAAVRNDFRSTIFWDGHISVNRSGKKEIEFYNSDEITTFRITVEGIGVGMPGHAEKKYFTQLPFSMFAKVPTEVVSTDILSLPVTLKNNTAALLTGVLQIDAPDAFREISSIPQDQSIPAFSAKTIYLNYRVMNKPGKHILKIAFQSTGLADAFQKEIHVVSKGFPVSLAFAGQDADREYGFEIIRPVDGSITALFTAYPSVVNDLMSGIESIIREPYGCFEQTSTSNYPNIMAMRYLEQTGQGDAALLASIENKLDKGYKRLTSYETKEKGYEWFGSAPGHEALTAYGLMQFHDMQNVYPSVDNKMIERTATWLLNKRDGKGGFSRNKKALDSFGRASEEVTNAYIVYALSEAGYRDQIKRELDKAYETSAKSADAYQMALVANALYNFNDKRADDFLQKLLAKQNKDGSWNADHSITRSGGKSLLVETTALAALAILNSERKDVSALQKAIKYLTGSRSGYGGFGSTQGTILALKALTRYAAFSKRTDEDGSIEIYVGSRMVKKIDYRAGQKAAVACSGLERYLKEGENKIRVKYVGVKTPLPYSIAVDYHTVLPQSDERCSVSMQSRLLQKTCRTGETVRMATVLENTLDRGIPMTMAVIGIPSGLSPQPWQLKEMQEKGMVDFYEVAGNKVICYYRDMAPGEKHIINLDLKAEVPGRFEAPASSAYLYYTSEYKCWASAGEITIKK